MNDLPPDPFPPEPREPQAIWTLDGLHLAADVEVIPLNLDAPDLAQWCDSCLLPAAAGYRFRILVNGAAIRTGFTLIVCHDCGATRRITT